MKPFHHFGALAFDVFLVFSYRIAVEHGLMDDVLFGQIKHLDVLFGSVTVGEMEIVPARANRTDDL